MEKFRKALMENPHARSPVTANSTVTFVPPTTFVPQVTQDGANSAPEAAVDWTEDALVKSHPNFNHVPRVSSRLPPEELLAKIKEHESLGVPLIVEGWHEHPNWNADLFSAESFVGDGEQIVEARNVRTAQDVKMPLRQLVEHYEAISKKAEPNEQTRFYGKDVHCPEKWVQWLTSGVLPHHLHPFGPGDMFSHLPIQDRPETLMCYLGIGDTFTPAHKDLCGSFGHNLMCHTADGGSAFWFMSATGLPHKDEPALYFHDVLDTELDLESHMVTVAELSRAPFGVYVAEQRLGDLVLVPPRSCHQVVNRGGVTIKMSWSRMGLRSLELSLYNELPLYHRVCRQEIYRVKLNVYYAVIEYARRLAAMDLPASSSTSNQPGLPLPFSSDHPSSTQLADNTPTSSSVLAETISTLKSLLFFLDEILVEEWYTDHMELKHLAIPAPEVPYEQHSCDFCGADIFQSFFACSECIDGDSASEFICCPSCYVEGRSCTCGEGIMEPRQSRPFDELMRERNKAADTLNLHLPEDEQLRSSTSRLMETAKHLHIFNAACKLRHSKIKDAENWRGKPYRRCTTRMESEPAHDAPTTHVLPCSPCHAAMCFRHILLLHDLYSAEAILVQAQDTEHAAWHTLHLSKTGKRKALPLSERRGRGRSGPPPLASRMAWVAAKFRKCRPMDAVRASVGFYDDFKLVGFSEEQDTQESGEIVQVPSPASGSATVPGSQAVLAEFDTVDSPLTELPDLNGEDSMDVDDDNSSDGSVWSPPPRTPSSRKRVTAQSIDRSNEALSIRRPRIVLDHVSISSNGRKRSIALDAAISTTPSKKAKPFSHGTRGPGSLSLVTRRVDSASSIGPSPSPTAKQSHLSGPATLPRKRPDLPIGTPRPEKVPPGARIGRPPASAKRKSAISHASSSRKADPAKVTPSEPSSMPSSTRPSQIDQSGAGVEAADSFHRTVNLLSNLLESERGEKEKTKVLLDQAQAQLYQTQAQLPALKIEVRMLKEDASVRQASDLRAQVDKLKANLRDSRQQCEENTERAEMAERMLQERTCQWTQTLAQCNRDNEILTKRIRDSEASVAERDHSMNGMVRIAGVLGHGIGSGIHNPPQPQTLHVHASPSAPSPMQCGPQAQTMAMVGPVSYPFNQSGPMSWSPHQPQPPQNHNWQWRRGAYYARGRGAGRRPNTAGSPHSGQFHQHPPKRPQVHPRHDSRFPSQRDAPRGGSVPVQYSRRDGRPRTPDVYEHSQPSMHGDDTSTAPHDQLEYRDHRRDERERSSHSQASPQPIVGMGDGGWHNVHEHVSGYPPDSRRSSSRSLTPPRYSRSVSPRRRDPVDDRELNSRPSTPDTQNYLEARGTSDPPRHEQERLDEGATS